MPRKRKAWSHSAGERPNTITVYEREPGGVIYARAWNPAGRGGQGCWIRKSLKHRDRQRAKDYALEQAAALKKGEDEISRGRVTLAQVLTQYGQHRTPRKSKGEQKEDARRTEMWTRWLGGQKDPHEVSLREWETFADLRASGEIDGRANRVPEKKRESVRAATVAHDLKWLRYVLA